MDIKICILKRIASATKLTMRMAKSILNSYHKTVTINTVGNEPSQNRNLVYNESLIDL